MKPFPVYREWLPVMEQFYSIQGEGRNTGKAAWFLRIGGCDVGCHFCDSKESWNADIHPPVNVNDLVNNASDSPARAVVITGGEPEKYDLSLLTRLFHEAGFEIFIETSGTETKSGNYDWVCLSPKKGSEVLPEWFEVASEMKIIIESEADFVFAEKCAIKARENCFLLLQPEWSKAKMMYQPIVEYILQNPRWHLSLQSHKFINIP